MNIALCIHGQARALNTSVYDALKNVTIATFIHTWWDGTYEYKNVGLTNGKYNVTIPKDFLTRLHELLKPTVCVLESPKQIPIPPNFTNFALIDSSHTMPMMYSVQEALRLPFDKHGNTFDWYVKARFDLVLQSEIQFHQLDPNYVYFAKIHPQGLPDASVVLISSKHITKFINVMECISQCGNVGVEEHIFHHLMRMKNVEFKSLNLNYYIDRASFSTYST